jgi:hypothetical protein
MWPQYWGLYEPRGLAKGPKGVKSHPTKLKKNTIVSDFQGTTHHYIPEVKTPLIFSFGSQFA